MSGKLGKGLAAFAVLAAFVLVALYFTAPQFVYRAALALERSLAGLEERSVQVSEFEIRYLEGGEGETLLLLHGFGADKDNWARIAADLTPHYRVIVPDLPGFGESTRPDDADYRVVTQARRMHALVQALDLGPVHVAGNSMGGAIAGAFAANYPETTRSLWLLAPAGVVDAPLSELFELITANRPNPLLPGTRDEFYELLDFVFEHPPYLPSPVKRVLAERAVSRLPLHTEIFEQIFDERFDVAKALSQSRVPTLIVWGRQDRLLHPGGAEVLERTIPYARVRMLDATGHVPMLERPERVARDFVQFERSLPATPLPAPVEPWPEAPRTDEPIGQET